LNKDIKDTLNSGGRIYLCGCGATGRLSLLLEFLWREQNPDSDQVISLMAGGDVALVNSLEGFEDYPEYGERHLKQLGFSHNDLLVSCTEGGETPYVIGATEAATTISQRSPYFLYCNPDDLLVDKVERSKKVIENSGIEKICLYVGPMALSGSTRMQASTVLQLGVGMALLDQETSVDKALQNFTQLVSGTDFTSMSDFTEEESKIYKEGDYLIYKPYSYAITVFTDTTERSPTFSLPPFESKDDFESVPSLCYVTIPQSRNEESAWFQLLNHEPRALDWADIDSKTLTSELHNFDFSENVQQLREKKISGKKQFAFDIRSTSAEIELSLNQLNLKISHGGLSSLYQHTLLKLLLNAHSTLLMGRLDRYQSNIMTWVTPTNGKLIARSARYVQGLLREKNIEKAYEEVVRRIFKHKDSRKEDEPIVLKTFESFLEGE
ncbi:MAG: hypothetical protein HRT44_12640, partial [Bdellovibrionales bacterium]|nr:hypothetical protein [Bdellovibrionales bacterium]NQZ20085.1 hypothetical protein [Bdellovibrionales bacterium]